MVTTTCYERSAWIGNLIVEPEHRYGGLGTLLMNHAMSYLCERGIKTIRLEADPPGVKLYRRLGFLDEFESLRFTGKAPAGDAEVCDAIDREGAETIASYDAHRFGDDRGRMLSLLLAEAVSVFCSREGAAMNGFAVAMPTATGVRIGPLVANDDRIARKLLGRVLACHPGQGFIVGVPAANGEAVRIFDDLGWRSTPSSFRMVWGEPQASGCQEQIFAIANGAIG
jgi:hypothetical protein